MKAETKLHASSFSVVTLQLSFPAWSRSSSTCNRMTLDSWVPSHFGSPEEMFPWGRKWIAFCGWKSWNPTPMFDARFGRCTQSKQHQLFTDLWCAGTSVWKRQDGKHCFVSCPCGNSFPVRWCAISLLSYSCLSGQKVSCLLDRKMGTHFLTFSFSRFDSSRFSSWGL